MLTFALPRADDEAWLRLVLPREEPSVPADRKWSASVRADIVTRYTRGEKISAIAEATGVPQSTIFHILADEGVAPARMTRRKTAPTTAQEQVATLEWFVQRLFELERDNERLRSLLLEWNLDPETGEVLDGDESP